MRGYAAIGLYAPKIESNVGGALRASHCYGASMIAIEGARYRNQITNTTKAERHIPMIHGPLTDIRPFDCPMVVVELVDSAVSLVDFRHPERAFYVFGPEDGSVPSHVVAAAQYVVMVPTAYCMNLAATVNVVLYDRLVKNGGM